MQVTLVSSTANYVGCTIEEFVVYTARVSSQKPKEERSNDAKKLLKYMLKNGHWSPFEQVNIGFNVVTTRAISAQICRHKSLSIQELSQRYKEIAWEDFEMPEMRLISNGGNRQGSGEVYNTLNNFVGNSITVSFNNYNELIKEGIAPECARNVLPMCSPTELYLNASLRNWIHFLAQRLDWHAQKEIRDIAKLIHIELVKLFPITFEILKESYFEEVKPTVNIWEL